MSEPRSGRRRSHARDEQHPTPFAAILAELLQRLPGARAAALTDAEGETVDYAGEFPPFDLRLAAAHWCIVLHELARSRAFVEPLSFVVRADRWSYLIWALPDGYALVVVLGRRAGMSRASRALVACERALCVEAGWRVRASLPRWYPVVVHCDKRKRPLRVRDRAARVESHAAPLEHPHAVHVLGAVVDLAPRERGYRVRLASGAELTLLREPGGAWYSDEILDLADPPPPHKPAEKPQPNASRAAHKKKR
jgi:hypothetical protein